MTTDPNDPNDPSRPPADLRLKHRGWKVNFLNIFITLLVLLGATAVAMMWTKVDSISKQPRAASSNEVWQVIQQLSSLSNSLNVLVVVTEQVSSNQSAIDQRLDAFRSETSSLASKSVETAVARAAELVKVSQADTEQKLDTLRTETSSLASKSVDMAVLKATELVKESQAVNGKKIAAISKSLRTAQKELADAKAKLAEAEAKAEKKPTPAPVSKPALQWACVYLESESKYADVVLVVDLTDTKSQKDGLRARGPHPRIVGPDRTPIVFEPLSIRKGDVFISVWGTRNPPPGAEILPMGS